jgi:multidrug efflux system membrane fusion protein
MSVPSPPFETAETPEEPGRGRWRRLLWIAAVVVLVAAVVAIIVIRHRNATQAPTGNFGRGGPLTVGIAQVSRSDVPIKVAALGTVTPLATVTVHPQVTGPLVKIAFSEGQIVKAGDLLADIDPRPFQAVLDESIGALKRDQALLANARIDLDRYKMLVAENSVSEQQYATQQATVAQDEAIVATDQGAVEAATLNLNYCRITSPVTGRVGLRQVDIGNLVTANSSTIVVVTQMQPMSVLFPVPEDSLSAILQRLNRGEKLSIDAYDRSLTNRIASGVLANADNEIDPTTGTLKLRGMFDNKDLALFPNQFVNVQLLLDTLHDQVTVPGAAVQNGSAGSYVYVVNADSTVNVRPVKAGPTSGDLVAINAGLQPGETVVVDGADQLRDGAHVILPAAAAGAAAGGRQHRGGGAAGGGGFRRRNGPGGPGSPGIPGGGGTGGPPAP